MYVGSRIGEKKMKTILVVYDEPNIRDTIKMVLEKKESSAQNNVVDFIQKPFYTIELVDKGKKILGE